MTQQTSPFIDAKFGWSLGESGWNLGMDENLLKFSFLFDRNIDGIVTTLPAAVNGKAYYLTTDKKLYFVVNSTYYSSSTPKWFVLTLRATGETYQFDGSDLVSIPSSTQLATELDGIQVTLSNLGTAAFEDIGFFPTQTDLASAIITANNYTNQEIADIATKNDDTKGAYQVGFEDTTVGDRLRNVYHCSQFGIKGTDLVTAPFDEYALIQAAFNFVAAKNGTLEFDARNYLCSQPVIVSGGFRSFKIKGSGTGNAQTASTGGTTFLSSGGYRAIQVLFNTFSNENFKLEGINFYNLAQNVNDFEAISIVRGESNNRYISGFEFKDVGVSGYGAGLSFQGMNTSDTGLNYFGTVILDNVHIADTGIAVSLSNCSLNLLDMRSVLFHTCPQGAIRLFRDGLVGSGLGRGSSITCHVGGKSHFENCAGMLRSQTTRTFGGTGTGPYLRSTFHLDGLLHEYCGTTLGNPSTGDPYLLGVDTDVIITGDVNYNLGFMESAFPVIGAGNTITSSSTIRVTMNGGRSLSPRMVNSPIIRRTILNTASTTFTLTTAEAANFALKSTLILQGGSFGVVETMHNGTPSGTKNNTVVSGPIPNAATTGITVSFAAGAGGSVINCTVLNNSTQTITAEFQVDNMSSCSITTPSEI